MRLGLLALASLFLSSSPAVAADSSSILARAVALQPPVWVERDGGRAALGPGAPLYPGDRYQTGPGARLHLELEDGSTVKLGESAQFDLPALALVDDGSRDGVLKGALKVVKGAFRFTTSALGALRRRDLDVYIGPTITAGIRGTDIWGKADASRELICLIEGRIEVSSRGSAAQVMDKPLTYYTVPRDQPPQPVIDAPHEEIAGWVPQTELVPDDLVQFAGGRYRLVLASFGALPQAGAESRRLSALGYATDVLAVPGGRYRVLMSGFGSRGEALRFAQLLRRRLGIAAPWVMAPG